MHATNDIKTQTPQGFPVSVNPLTGAWEQLVLAQNTTGDAAGAMTLQFQPPSAALQTALQSNQLFLVISYDNGTALTNFSNEIGIADWPFKLDVPKTPLPGAYRNVLIFKFDNNSLIQNVQDPQHWNMPETFNNASNNGLVNLSAWLQNFIQAAIDKYSQGDDDYAYFCNIATDPTWNGIIALGVDINVQHLPPGLQGPLAGIGSNLFYAHHFGVEANKLNYNAATNSSLFALIDYEDQTPEPLHDVTLLKLKVVFSNSEISKYQITWHPEE